MAWREWEIFRRQQVLEREGYVRTGGDWSVVNIKLQQENQDDKSDVTSGEGQDHLKQGLVVTR